MLLEIVLKFLAMSTLMSLKTILHFSDVVTSIATSLPNQVKKFLCGIAYLLDAYMEVMWLPHGGFLVPFLTMLQRHHSKNMTRFTTREWCLV